MKYLYLMRHAKSFWMDDSLSDLERPLNKRGKKAAPKMAKVLSEFDHPPELILTSHAVRAATTAGYIKGSDAFAETPCVEEEPLYSAGSETIFDVIRTQDDRYRSLLVIGHNPGMENLASMLCTDHDDITMPTAALILLHFPVDRWRDVKIKRGHLGALVFPKNLA